MCNDAGSGDEFTKALTPSKSSRVTWQSNFEKLTGKTPAEMGFKTEAAAQEYLLSKAQARQAETVLTGYSGSPTVH